MNHKKNQLRKTSLAKKESSIEILPLAFSRPETKLFVSNKSSLTRKKNFFNRCVLLFFGCSRKDDDDAFWFYVPAAEKELLCKVKQINTR